MEKIALFAHNHDDGINVSRICDTQCCKMIETQCTVISIEVTEWAVWNERVALHAHAIIWYNVQAIEPTYYMYICTWFQACVYSHNHRRNTPIIH